MDGGVQAATREKHSSLRRKAVEASGALSSSFGHGWRELHGVERALGLMQPNWCADMKLMGCTLRFAQLSRDNLRFR